MSKLLTLPLSRITDANGNPLSGALLYAYVSGGTTLTPVYTTEARDTEHTNPVVADGNGLLPAIYLDPNVTYRFKAKTSAGADIAGMDYDPVSVTSSGDISFTPEGSGVVSRSAEAKLGEFFTATDFEGVEADGTDQTAAIIAGVVAHLGAQDRKTVIIPPGVVWHPQEALEDTGVLARERLNFLDLSGMSAKRGVNENTKIFGIYGVDPAADEDTYWVAASGHHPVFMLNNLGSANTGSAEQGFMSILYARGFFTDGLEDERQFIGAMIAQYRRSVLDATIWEHVWRSLAPWPALADGVIRRRWAATREEEVGNVVLTNTSKWYRCTVAGTTGTVVPNHSSGTAVDGTVTWEYLDSEDRLVFGFDEHGRVKSNGAGSVTDLVAFKQAITDDTTTAVMRLTGTGESRAVRLIFEPTDAASAIVPSPAIGVITSGTMEIRAAGGGGSLIATIDNNGDILLYLGRLGYGAGSGNGGQVTQDTSRTTGVTLHKPTGSITLVSAAGQTAWQTFTVTNNKVSATDNIIVHQKSGADKYLIHVTAVANGSFDITFATTGGTTTEQPVFNFSVIRGAAD